MKISPPKSVLDQLRLQVQLDEKIAELGNELRALPELGAAMARVGVRTTTIPEKELPLFDLETGSEGSDETRRFEAFPLAKQAGVLRDALLGILPSARVDNAGDDSEEGEQEIGSAPVLISRLAQGVASLERTVYSTGLLCQVTGTMLRALEKDAVEEASSLVVSFFHSANRLQEVIDVLGKVSAQNSQAILPSSDYERFVQYLKEAQQKLDELEGPDLPKLPEYTPAFFAKRHNRSENTTREHLKAWSERKKNEDRTREIGRWCITDWDIAVAFDNYLWRNRRTKASDTKTA